MSWLYGMGGTRTEFTFKNLCIPSRAGWKLWILQGRRKIARPSTPNLEITNRNAGKSSGVLADHYRRPTLNSNSKAEKRNSSESWVGGEITTSSTLVIPKRAGKTAFKDCARLGRTGDWVAAEDKQGGPWLEGQTRSNCDSLRVRVNGPTVATVSTNHAQQIQSWHH